MTQADRLDSSTESNLLRVTKTKNSPSEDLPYRSADTFTAWERKATNREVILRRMPSGTPLLWESEVDQDSVP